MQGRLRAVSRAGQAGEGRLGIRLHPNLANARSTEQDPGPHPGQGRAGSRQGQTGTNLQLRPPNDRPALAFHPSSPAYSAVSTWAFPNPPQPSSFVCSLPHRPLQPSPTLRQPSSSTHILRMFKKMAGSTAPCTEVV